jgi:V/A-type H+-transporting ATPase subunit I
MAVAQMAKVMIVSHRTQASELLEALQREGICQILNAQEAIVSRDMPELVKTTEKPKDIQQLLERLGKSISFLKDYAEHPKGLAAVLAPRAVINERTYRQVVSSKEIPEVIERCRESETAIEKLKTERGELINTLEQLRPWVSLETPVEEIDRLQQAKAMAGLIPAKQIEGLKEQLDELGAAVEVVGIYKEKLACIVACLNQNLSNVQKVLRAAEFEAVDFEDMAGIVAGLIKNNSEKLKKTENQLDCEHKQALSLGKNLLKLEILNDHYANLLNREQAKEAAPMTEQTVLLEGWVKEEDYPRLEKLVSHFDASSLGRIEPAEGEDVPVEIENKSIIKPFEVITRLYGMPQHFDVDPTVFLAPFFAIFFGLCLTDAGYGIVLLAFSIYLLTKIQGDRKFMWMLAICSAATIVAGALMGGWFGDAVQKFVPSLEPLRQKVMWFDPMQYPLRFFALSLILGYIQIMAGLLIAFLHDLKRKLYIAALCDRLSWLIMLNSIVAYAFAKTGRLPSWSGSLFGYAALFSASVIFLFSHRQGGWPVRLGMGFYNLFSALFYVGDVLSYLRLMALGLVTAGLAMAWNQFAELAYRIPFVGLILAILILVVCHPLNIGINALGAFVHSLRLQYAEFFPKFFTGGGLPFKPLGKSYKHIYIEKLKNKRSEGESRKAG